MQFEQALSDAIARAGWKTDRHMDQDEKFIRQISPHNDAGMQTRVEVRRSDVARTWNTWDETKQKRALDKLAAFISNILRRVQPGMAVSIHPDDWTPDA